MAIWNLFHGFIISSVSLQVYRNDRIVDLAVTYTVGFHRLSSRFSENLSVRFSPDFASAYVNYKMTQIVNLIIICQRISKKPSSKNREIQVVLYFLHWRMLYLARSPLPSDAKTAGSTRKRFSHSHTFSVPKRGPLCRISPPESHLYTPSWSRTGATNS